MSALTVPGASAAAIAAALGTTTLAGPHVDFGHLWLTDAADLTASFRLKFLAGSNQGWPSGASVGVLAKGRTRASRGPRPAARTWTPQLGTMPVELAKYLEDVAGTAHWARDPLGGKVCCLWESAPIVWRGRESSDGSQVAAVSLTLQQFSHAEA